MRLNKLLKSVSAVLLLTFWIPQKVLGAEVVYSWHTNDKNIALTFDDGPHPVYTPEILDILEEYGIKATFFTIGQNVEWYNDVFRMEYEAGHEIGNHTYSHLNLRRLPYPEVCREIEQAENLVYETVEYRTRLLRPPEGAFGHDLCKAASEMDYTVICWSVDTLDWAHTPSETIVRNVLENVKGGDIILFHDYISGDSPTPDALREIIPALLDEGYRFVTVSELLNLR